MEVRKFDIVFEKSHDWIISVKQIIGTSKVVIYHLQLNVKKLDPISNTEVPNLSRIDKLNCRDRR